MFSDAVHANADHVADLMWQMTKMTSQLVEEDGQEGEMAKAIHSQDCPVRSRDTNNIKEVPGHHVAT